MTLLFNLFDALVIALIALALGIGFLSFGGVTERGGALLALACLAAGIATVLRMLVALAVRRPPPRLAALPAGSLLCWLLFLLWAGMGALPIRADWLARLSPAGAAWYAAWGGLLGIAPHLSVDPQATQRAWMLLLAFTIAGLASAQFATSRRRRDRLLLLLLACQGAAVVYAFLELAGIVGNTFGWKVPTGPLLNRNHFAGMMILAAPLAAGWAATLALRRAQSHRRRGDPFDWHALLNSHLILWVLLPVVFGGTCFSTLSRSGLAGCGAALLLWLGMIARHTGARLAARIAAGGVILGALVITVAGIEPITQRFQDLGIAFDVEEPYSRAQIWSASWRIAADYPLTGSGLGSFYGAYMPYAPANTKVLPIYAHSDWLQLLVETGFPGFFLVLAALMLFVRAVLRRIRAADATEAPLLAGALAGLLGILLQSLGEFPLRLPFVGLQFVLVLALALGKGTRERAHRRRARHASRSLGELAAS